jgi:hypothetical protein
MSKASEKQVGGSHYTDMKIQPFTFSMANGLDPMRHTIIKYVCRKKGGKEDLLKARHTLDLLIEWEYPEEEKKHSGVPSWALSRNPLYAKLSRQKDIEDASPEYPAEEIWGC